jgi:hypothetical protein
MFVDQIRERFRNGSYPLTVELSNGRKLRVPHEDFIAVSPKVVVVIDAKGISHTINPLHIVSIGEGPGRH